MHNGKFAIVVQGLFENTDSIGYDAISQYKLLRRLTQDPGGVRIFAETVASSRYLDLPIEDITRLKEWIEAFPDVTLIYHWCDGWPAFHNWLITVNCRTIVRWHNNTPPWFFGRYSAMPIRHTIRGYRGILDLARKPSIEFWTNSEFSRQQLSFLKVNKSQTRVVYPASKFIDDEISQNPNDQALNTSDGPIRILFVGRVVPHKGHKHLIAVANIVQKTLGRTVMVILPGRSDGSMPEYKAELQRLSSELRVDISFPGEINHNALMALYSQSDVFLCLSEHEGFGLPVFEAMQMGIPVVGARTTAFRELLAEHPLAVDDIEYPAVAAMVIAALNAQIRTLVTDWQRQLLSTIYTSKILESQIVSGLDAKPFDEQPPLPRDVEIVDIVCATQQEWSEKILAIVEATLELQNIPVDQMNRFVTRYDIETYESLLGADQQVGSFLFEEVMNTRIQSSRRWLGPVMRRLRRLALSIQIGIVNGLSLLDAHMKRRSDATDAAIADVKWSLERLRKTQRELNEWLKSEMAQQIQSRGEVVPNAAIDALAAPPKHVPEISGRPGSTFGGTAELYVRSYFEGEGSKSNYHSYSRDAFTPSQILAQTLFELFSPKSALEAGCALGYVVKTLHELGVSAYGFDISEWAVEQAAVPFITRFDFSVEPIADKFDLVYCYDVVEHIPLERLEFALKNLWESTTGTLVIVPALYAEGTTYDPNEPTHLIFHDRPWWTSFMQHRCGIPLDDVLTARLDQAEHSTIFNYSGRVFVATRR
jgi:glycosyltransferase involved in cell wall biosynthesis/2-polyprenyl-3-methyl-5-hydroxy-6-metoxy-1,4-benzoquinol methylase